MGKKIDVLVFEPHKKAYTKTIDAELKSYQEIVGGYIELVYFDDEENNVLVCNEEGKITGLDPNMALIDSTGQVYDIVCGTFFICSLDDEDELSSIKNVNAEAIQKMIPVNFVGAQ